MHFRINRISDFLDNQPPTEAAVRNEAGKWTIEINTLSDLIALMQKEGAIILRPGQPSWSDLDEIEIYDDYME